MTINKQSASYKIAHTIYLSLGGDPEKEFTSVEEIYQDVDQIYGESGGRVTVDPLKVELTTNGTTIFDDANITGYKPVEISVNVDVGTAYDDGYNTGVADQKGKLESISITENGTYSREDGYNQVKVNVQGKLEVPFEEIGYPSELKNELNAGLNSKPLSDLEYSKKCYNENKTYYNGDTKLVYAPLVDTSNVTSMGYMFQSCSALITVPHFNTSKVTNMSRMFSGCSLLTSVPLFDTNKVNNMSYMFNGCKALTTVPPLDTSSVNNIMYMFSGCNLLTTIPSFDLSNVTSMNCVFEYCYALKSIPLLDFGSITDISYIFGFGDLTNLTDIGGFKNLGMQPTLSVNNTYGFNKAPNMTHESVMNIINNLYDRKSAGYSVVTLKFATKTLALLSDEEIAIATNKGWIIS